MRSADTRDLNKEINEALANSVVETTEGVSSNDKAVTEDLEATKEENSRLTALLAQTQSAFEDMKDENAQLKKQVKDSQHERKLEAEQHQQALEAAAQQSSELQSELSAW